MRHDPNSCSEECACHWYGDEESYAEEWEELEREER